MGNLMPPVRTVDFAFDTGASFDLVLPTPSTPGDQLFIQGDVHGPGVHINAVTDDVGNTWTNPDFGQASNVILEFWACQADRAVSRITVALNSASDGGVALRF